MPEQQTLELVTVDTLLEKVGALCRQGSRLVQISATRLLEQLELTYSFDIEGQLTNLRLHVPVSEARVPSVSSIYWCAFLYENEMHDLFNLQVDDMAVDFHGNLYKTAVKYPFGSTKPPVPAPARAPVQSSESVITPSAAAAIAAPAMTVNPQSSTLN
jgi:ech hydrogenase subunit D